MAFEFMQCENVYRTDGEGVFLNINAYDIVCLSPSFWRWTIGVALPMIILWGLVTPIVSARGVALARKVNPDMPFTYVDHPSGPKMMYAYFVDSYHNSDLALYWEFFFMVRRMIMVFLVNLVPYVSNSFTVILCEFIICVNFLMQLRYKPFNRDLLNELERNSLFTSIIFYASAMYFATPNPNLAVSLFLIIFSLFFVFSFVL